MNIDINIHAEEKSAVIILTHANERVELPLAEARTLAQQLLRAVEAAEKAVSVLQPPENDFDRLFQPSSALEGALTIPPRRSGVPPKPKPKPKPKSRTHPKMHCKICGRDIGMGQWSKHEAVHERARERFQDYKRENPQDFVQESAPDSASAAVDPLKALFVRVPAEPSELEPPVAETSDATTPSVDESITSESPEADPWRHWLDENKPEESQ